MATTNTDTDTDTETETESSSIDRITNHESLLSDIIPNAGFSAEYLKPFGFENAPEKLEKRIENAGGIDREVIPEGEGLYTFHDPDGSTAYTLNLTGQDDRFGQRAVCGCPDYNYSAADGGFDCKHAVYVKLLIAAGYLPPIEVTDVTQWMGIRLQLFERFLEEEIENTISTVIREELTEVLEQVNSEKQIPKETSLIELEAVVDDVLVE